MNKAQELIELIEKMGIIDRAKKKLKLGRFSDKAKAKRREKIAATHYSNKTRNMTPEQKKKYDSKVKDLNVMRKAGYKI